MVKNAKTGTARPGKVVSTNIKVPEPLFLRFKEGIYSEGFSINEAILLLIEKYCRERDSD